MRMVYENRLGVSIENSLVDILKLIDEITLVNLVEPFLLISKIVFRMQNLHEIISD